MVFPAVFRRVCLCVWAAVLVAALPRVAAADDLRADFDRDGVTDVVTLDPASTSLLHVWLSTTQTERELRTSRPVYRMVAVDLDGDGRPELVVSDTHATLHIWRHAGNGRLRQVHPHAAPVQREARDGATLHDDPAQSDTAIPTRLSSPVLDSLPRTPHTAPLTLRGHAPAKAVAPFDRPASPWSSRAPPYA
jgi:hypothetical protein